MGGPAGVKRRMKGLGLLAGILVLGQFLGSVKAAPLSHSNNVDWPENGRVRDNEFVPYRVPETDDGGTGGGNEGGQSGEEEGGERVGGRREEEGGEGVEGQQEGEEGEGVGGRQEEDGGEVLGGRPEQEGRGGVGGGLEENTKLGRAMPDGRGEVEQSTQAMVAAREGQGGDKGLEGKEKGRDAGAEGEQLEISLVVPSAVAAVVPASVLTEALSAMATAVEEAMMPKGREQVPKGISSDLKIKGKEASTVHFQERSSTSPPPAEVSTVGIPGDTTSADQGLTEEASTPRVGVPEVSPEENSQTEAGSVAQESDVSTDVISSATDADVTSSPPLPESASTISSEEPSSSAAPLRVEETATKTLDDGSRTSTPITAVDVSTMASPLSDDTFHSTAEPPASEVEHSPSKMAGRVMLEGGTTTTAVPPRYQGTVKYTKKINTGRKIVKEDESPDTPVVAKNISEEQAKVRIPDIKFPVSPQPYLLPRVAPTTTTTTTGKPTVIAQQLKTQKSTPGRPEAVETVTSKQGVATKLVNSTSSPAAKPGPPTSQTVTVTRPLPSRTMARLPIVNATTPKSVIPSQVSTRSPITTAPARPPIVTTEKKVIPSQASARQPITNTLAKLPIANPTTPKPEIPSQGSAKQPITGAPARLPIVNPITTDKPAMPAQNSANQRIIKLNTIKIVTRPPTGLNPPGEKQPPSRQDSQIPTLPSATLPSIKVPPSDTAATQKPTKIIPSNVKASIKTPTKLSSADALPPPKSPTSSPIPKTTVKPSMLPRPAPTTGKLGGAPPVNAPQSKGPNYVHSTGKSDRSGNTNMTSNNLGAYNQDKNKWTVVKEPTERKPGSTQTGKTTSSRNSTVNSFSFSSGDKERVKWSVDLKDPSSDLVEDPTEPRRPVVSPVNIKPVYGPPPDDTLVKSLLYNAFG